MCKPSEKACVACKTKHANRTYDNGGLYDVCIWYIYGIYIWYRCIYIIYGNGYCFYIYVRVEQAASLNNAIIKIKKTLGGSYANSVFGLEII